MRTVNTIAAANVLILLSLAGCSQKERDVVAEIRALIPDIQQKLNDRDLGGLKRMGTANFQENAFVTDLVPGPNDSVKLGFKSMINEPGKAVVIVRVLPSGQTGTVSRELTLNLTGSGHWHIDSYTVTGKAGE